jgi:hypothetical protein
MSRRLIRVNDLELAPPGALLLCPTCGAENSATRDDYFLASPMTVFRCCGHAMRLVTKRTCYRDVVIGGAR